MPSLPIIALRCEGVQCITYAGLTSLTSCRHEAAINIITMVEATATYSASYSSTTQ